MRDASQVRRLSAVNYMGHLVGAISIDHLVLVAQTSELAPTQRASFGFHAVGRVERRERGVGSLPVLWSSAPMCSTRTCTSAMSPGNGTLGPRIPAGVLAVDGRRRGRRSTGRRAVWEEPVLRGAAPIGEVVLQSATRLGAPRM